MARFGGHVFLACGAVSLVGFAVLVQDYVQNQLQGIKTGVDVYRDEHGIPYIFGQNADDASYVQAFIEYTVVMGAAISSAWSEAAAKLPARPIEFALLDWEPYTAWTPNDVLQISVAFTLFLNRGFTVDFCRVLLKKELGRYWKAFDIRVTDPRIPFVNSEGIFPSLFDQNGFRISLPPEERRDDAWARRRPERDGAEQRQEVGSEGPEAGEPGHGGGSTRDDEKDPKITAGKWGGSNSWAVSGKYTASGFPILAGDPHLEAHAPGAGSGSSRGEEEARQAAEKKKPSRLIGAAFVGTGTIFVGHNGDSAWSHTIAHTDIEDLFLIKLDPSGKNYLYDGQWIPLRTRVEEIAVKGVAKPVKRLLRFTHHGPLVTDLYKELRELVKEDEALAFASVAVRSPAAVDFTEQLNSAKNWKDLVTLGRVNQQIEFVTVWATREGDIGASLTGGVPERSPAPDGGGDFRDGSKSSSDWNGAVPTETLPHVMNPPQGFVATANCQIAPDAEDVLGQAYVPGNRIRRIHERLNALIKRKKVTVQDMMDVQLDVESVNGREFRDYVLRTVLFAFTTSPLADSEKNGEGSSEASKATQGARQGEERDHSSHISPEARRVQEMCSKEGVTQQDGKLLADIFRKWDGRMNVESIGATVYEVWMQWLLQDLFKLHKFSDHALFVVAGKSSVFRLDLTVVAFRGGFHSTWLPRTEMLNHWRDNILRALENNDNLISDVTTPVSLLCMGASSALRWLRVRYGEAGTLWFWGSVRARFFTHALGEAVPLLRHTASIGPLRWGGNYGTIRAHHNEPHVLSHETPRESQYTKGLDTPTFRMVVDTGDFTNCYWAFSPGVSGWVGSRHYSDMAQSMAEGSEFMLPMLWTDEQIAGAAVTHARFLPVGFKAPRRTEVDRRKETEL
ncbi:putative penicillin amidase domain-containing protein [Neospora caninum Liverpool]|uniref:Putative penicillin amidase domain-containing protein n=1 Tax=Neospora caninum (strain Liverpool) TaxID=572307 RepID=F0VLA1_NEOCL|nr:putative penicillin amidase domain-containing protein [Neospora caninum Liverpool]CBZ54853.1 putative penicillin amidase domain-containing protein [Neospora caninum Liverpool]|eukprot:XP_003884881.1 putative penicillin amidase domain-containing protein [Neospora caninum Liverpool]